VPFSFQNHQAVPITRGDVDPDPLGNSELQRRPSAPIELTADWPLLLQQQKIGPLAIRYDMFTFDDGGIASTITAEAHDVQGRGGVLPTAETPAIGEPYMPP
jgi:hypothetical protein